MPTRLSLTEGLNHSRYAAGQAQGHYESFYQRANHPTRPLAFWIRYTVFSPKGQPDAAIGELWAVFFDGETGQHVVAKEEHPIGAFAFDRAAFGARVADSVLAPGALRGECSGPAGSLRWDLTYDGSEPPIFLLPENMYDTPIPKAKSLVGLPLATYRGRMDVDGREVDVDGWIGSQNHNWGSQHTDHYAFAQVAGFDNAPDSFLEVVSAQVKGGARTHPSAHLPGPAPRRARALARLPPARAAREGALRLLQLGLRHLLGGGPAVRPGHRPSGGVRRTQLLQPARRHQALPQHQNRVMRDHGDRPRHGCA